MKVKDNESQPETHPEFCGCKVLGLGGGTGYRGPGYPVYSYSGLCGQCTVLQSSGEAAQLFPVLVSKVS